MSLVHFFSCGSVERGRPIYDRRMRIYKPSYKLFDGWAEVTERGHVAPSLTRLEAKQEAKRRGMKAEFHYTEEAARAALVSGMAVQS